MEKAPSTSDSSRFEPAETIGGEGDTPFCLTGILSMYDSCRWQLDHPSFFKSLFLKDEEAAMVSNPQLSIELPLGGEVQSQLPPPLDCLSARECCDWHVEGGQSLEAH